MKTFSTIIFHTIILYTYVLCHENIDEIFNKTYINMLELPVGSTIYFSRNIKCASYNKTSSICLVNGNLYNLVGSEYTLLTTISDYSDFFYYELNIYNETNKEKMNCIITHFVKENKLIFKYYSININNNSFTTKDYQNYNNSFNPLNKGINCHTKDMEYNLTCFYLNKYINVIKIQVIYMMESNSVRTIFKNFDIQPNSYYINNNSIIMSFLYNNKFKFFSCFLFNESVSFYAYANDAPPNVDNYNNFRAFEFKCEKKEKMILFSVFKNKNEISSYQFQKTANKENLYTFYKTLKDDDDDDHLRRIQAEPDFDFSNIKNFNYLIIL